jgi:hypothetical protein
MHGRTMFIEVEKIYKYEHSSPNSFSTDSRTALLKEIDFEEFSFTPIGNRLILNYLEDFIKNHPDSTIDDLDGLGERELFIEKCPETEEMFKSLKDFLVVRPRLPGGHKEMKAQKSLSIPVDFSREDVVRYTHQKSESIEMARLALYAYRDMGKINWEPFLKAALERNPVSLEGLKGKSLDDILNLLSSLENQSIYSDQRLALPDEVWNFHRGDGIEKAILFMNVLRARNPQTPIELSVQYEKVTLTADGESYTFRSNKGLNKQLTI